MTDPANPSSVASTPPPTPAPATPPPRRKGGIGRFIKWTFVVLLLVIVAGGTIVWLNLNRIVKHTVETQSTAQLNLKTELDSAALSVFGGKVSLDDLRIASPQGFQAPQMFRLGGADVAVKLSALRSDPVRVSSITLDRPKLVIERSGNTFNFKRAMELMPRTPQKPADESRPLKLIIDELTVKDPTVVIRPGQINIPGLKLPEEITVSIPTITMKQIGTGEGAQNGAAVKDVVMQVITAMAAQAANSGQLPEQLKNLLNIDVKQAIAGLTDEARRRLAEALPGDAGRIVSEVLADPNALLKDPGKVIGAQAEQLKQQAQEEAQKRIGGLVGGATGASSQPATNPVDQAKQGAQKAVEKGLGDLLNRDKKKRDGDR